MDKLIITVAPVGAEVTRRDHPNLPLTAEEIAEEAAHCREQGASILHLHVRDAAGKPTQDKSAFQAVIDALRKEE